jgi:hypothetical protein
LGEYKLVLKGLGRSEEFVIHSDFSRFSGDSEESVNLNQVFCKGFEGIGPGRDQEVLKSPSIFINSSEKAPGGSEESINLLGVILFSSKRAF